MRATAVAAIMWLPLAILAAAEGYALTDLPRESFLRDFVAYSRYLIAGPALILSEGVYLPKLGRVLRHFEHAGFVREADRRAFDRLATSTVSLLADRRIGLALVLTAYGITFGIPALLYPVGTSTWAAPIIGNSQNLSWAGWWRLVVSQPLFLLLILTWLWRHLLWVRALWKLSRFDLRMVAGHPDGVGGLRFTVASLHASTGVAFALGTIVAGQVAEGVLNSGLPLTVYRHHVLAIAGLSLVIFAGPLVVFRRTLLRAHVNGLFEYGRLATALGRQFESRWIGASVPIEEDVLSRPDFSAAIDLYSVAANAYASRWFLVDFRATLPLIAATLAPFAPVVIMAAPLDDILRMAAQFLL